MRHLPKTLSAITIAAVVAVIAGGSASAQTRGGRAEPLAQPAQERVQASDPVVIPDSPWSQPAFRNAAPTFTVSADGFTAVDESGVDFAGSDEVFSTWSSGRSLMGTRVFGDVDSGESREYHDLQSCILPLAPRSFVDGRTAEGWRCIDGGATGPISFSVNLYEHDRISFPMCFNGGTGPQPDCADDWLGGYTGTWETAELVSMLPHAGSTQQMTVRLIACEPGTVCGVGLWDADYDFHFTITRLADREMPQMTMASR